MDPYKNQPYNNQPNPFQGLSKYNGPSTPYTGQALNEVKGYYDPYTEYARNPEDFLSRISQSFKQNPGQIRANDIRMKEHTGAAAASGRINNPQYEEEHGDLASALYNQDMQQYIDNIMKQQGLGFQAAQGAAGDVSNILGEEGAYAERASRQKQQDENAQWQAIIKAIGMMGGAYLGGPAGAAAGGQLAGQFAPGGGNEPEQGYGYNNPNYSNRNSRWTTR